MKINTSHCWDGFIERKLREYVSGVRLNFRHYDLSDTTDEPGNTMLGITYVDTHFPNTKEIIALLESEEGQGGPGDYEKFFILEQNNETLIIINFNK